MKITKQQLKQIIKEELRDYYGGESHPQSKADAAMPRRGTFHKGGLDWDTLDQETSDTISRVMEDFIERLRRVDNKDARSIMKSMREMLQLPPDQQQEIMSALTKMLATDSDPGQERF
jgi:hypothetical protein